jgi:hypothetical protein
MIVDGKIMLRILDFVIFGNICHVGRLIQMKMNENKLYIE